MAYLGTRRRPALGPGQRHYARLNYDSPLVQGLFVAVPDFAAAGDSTVRNVASPAHNIVNDYTDATFWRRGHFDYRGMPFVGGYSQDNATRFILPDVSAFIDATNQVTLSMIVVIAAGDATGDLNPWDLRNGAGSAQHYPYIDNTIYLGTFANARWLSGTATFPSALFGVPHLVTITFRNGAQELYIGERLVGTGSAASNPAVTYSGVYRGFGATIPSGTQLHYIGALWMWNRILMQGEVEYHVDNSWDTFEAAQRRRYFLPSAAPSGAKPWYHYAQMRRI